MTDKSIPDRLRQTWLLALIASLTLGLAPFTPEPHLFGKVRWVAGGAQGMSWIDYFDLIMHGAPWVALIYYSVAIIKYSVQKD